jgi:hypothetical protein
VTRSSGKEESDPFRPSNKIRRSPVRGYEVVSETLEDSEDSVGTQDSDCEVPTTARGSARPKPLVRRVAERNARRALDKMITDSEAEDSARDETVVMAEDDGDTEIMLTKTEMEGFVACLSELVSTMGDLLQRFKKDKEGCEWFKNTREIMRGVHSSLSQCISMKSRRRDRRRVPDNTMVGRGRWTEDAPRERRFRRVSWRGWGSVRGLGEARSRMRRLAEASG